MSTSHGHSSASTDGRGPGMSSTAYAGPLLWLAPGSCAVFALIMIFVLEDPVSTWSLGLTVVVMLLATWWFCWGKVVVDDTGVRVFGGNVLKLLEVKSAEVMGAEAREISPAEFGGWGLRIAGSGTAFILKRGPGLVVNRRKGSPRVYSVGSLAEAELMAARLNELAANNAR